MITTTILKHPVREVVATFNVQTENNSGKSTNKQFQILKKTDQNKYAAGYLLTHMIVGLPIAAKILFYAVPISSMDLAMGLSSYIESAVDANSSMPYKAGAMLLSAATGATIGAASVLTISALALGILHQTTINYSAILDHLGSDMEIREAPVLASNPESISAKETSAA